MRNRTSSLCSQAGVPHFQVPENRRQFLANAGAGFGAVALSGMLASSSEASRFVAAPDGHHPATAKRVIFLFMEGGPSQLDTFDRKPLLNQLAGQPLPNRDGGRPDAHQGCSVTPWRFPRLSRNTRALFGAVT